MHIIRLISFSVLGSILDDGSKTNSRPKYPSKAGKNDLNKYYYYGPTRVDDEAKDAIDESDGISHMI